MTTLNLLSEVEMANAIRRGVSMLCGAHGKESSGLTGLHRGTNHSIHWSTEVLGPSRYERCVPIASVEANASATGYDNNQKSR